MSAASTLRRPAELAAAGLIPSERVAELERVAARYAVAITPAMAELIDPADPVDPIARQFVPDAAELDRRPEEFDDPIGDGSHSPVPGIVHRYPDRVLLKLVSVCPVYCRFCFRREAVGREGPAVLSGEAVDRAFAYVAERPEIWELIVTGGDPLILSPRRIGTIGRRLAALEHVRIVRWHSRVPVVAPERITDELVGALKASEKTTWLAVHANHPRELTPAARWALARLADAGIPLVSQTVLLRGVNDDPAVLGALMRAFVENRVKPYYLHHGDLAPGTSRHRTSLAEGQSLMRALRGRHSGLCQPSYVLDIPGGHGKAPVGPCYVSGEDGARRVEDFQGSTHEYPPQS
jgi:lysine 2,3-aminomutase